MLPAPEDLPLEETEDGRGATPPGTQTRPELTEAGLDVFPAFCEEVQLVELPRT